jgi:hypothetical protein
VNGFFPWRCVGVWRRYAPLWAVHLHAWHLGFILLLHIVLSETVWLSQFSARGGNFRDQLVSLGVPYQHQSEEKKINWSPSALQINNQCTSTIQSQEHSKTSNYEQTWKLVATIVLFVSKDWLSHYLLPLGQVWCQQIVCWGNRSPFQMLWRNFSDIWITHPHRSSPLSLEHDRKHTKYKDKSHTYRTINLWRDWNMVQW